MDFQPNQKVWYHTKTGGYEWAIQVPAVVVAKKTKRYRVKVYKRHGVEEITVTAHKLTQRQYPDGNEYKVDGNTD